MPSLDQYPKVDSLSCALHPRDSYPLQLLRSNAPQRHQRSSHSYMYTFTAFCALPFPSGRTSSTRRRVPLTCALTSSSKSTDDEVRTPLVDAPFSEWAADNNIDMPALSLTSFSNRASQVAQAMRGMVAVEAVKKGNQLISVRRQTTLQVTSLDRKRTPIPSKISQATWESLPWFARLALLLVNAKLEPDGRLRPWIERLPKEFNTLFHWNEKELAELQNPQLVRAVHDQQKQYRKLFDVINSSTNNGIARYMKYDDFVWAVECVRSRAFSGPLEVAPFKERLRLFLFVVANTLVWPTVNAIPWENAVNGGLTALFALTAYDVVLPRILRVVQGVELRRFAMTPGIDFLNHDSRVAGKAEVSYEYFTDRFVVQAGEDYNAGDQVFISYGAQSNDSFLQYYGFVEDDNPAETYKFNREVEGILGVPEGSLIAKRGTGFENSATNAVASKLGKNKGAARTALNELCTAEIGGMKTSLAEDKQLLETGKSAMNVRLNLALRYRIEKKRVLEDAVQ